MNVLRNVFQFFACAEIVKTCQPDYQNFWARHSIVEQVKCCLCFHGSIVRAESTQAAVPRLDRFLKENLPGCEPGLKRGRHALAGRSRQFWNHGVYIQFQIFGVLAIVSTCECMEMQQTTLGNAAGKIVTKESWQDMQLRGTQSGHVECRICCMKDTCLTCGKHRCVFVGFVRKNTST